ncbi:MAG: hypothetical protein WC758_02235 [Candidatus Woesearchaeota archaeon]|jgi:hypothetical protein
MINLDKNRLERMISESYNQEREDTTINQILEKIEFCNTDFYYNGARHKTGVSIEKANIKKGLKGQDSTDYYHIIRRWNYGRDILIYPINGYKIISVVVPENNNKLEGPNELRFSDHGGIPCISFFKNHLKVFIGLNECPQPNSYEDPLH